MGVACFTLRILLRKGRYGDCLHWESMSKVPTSWSNIYVDGVLVMGEIIDSRGGGEIMETEFPTR